MWYIQTDCLYDGNVINFSRGKVDQTPSVGFSINEYDNVNVNLVYGSVIHHLRDKNNRCYTLTNWTAINTKKILNFKFDLNLTILHNFLYNTTQPNYKLAFNKINYKVDGFDELLTINNYEIPLNIASYPHPMFHYNTGKNSSYFSNVNVNTDGKVPNKYLFKVDIPSSITNIGECLYAILDIVIQPDMGVIIDKNSFNNGSLSRVLTITQAGKTVRLCIPLLTTYTDSSLGDDCTFWVSNGGNWIKTSYNVSNPYYMFTYHPWFKHISKFITGIVWGPPASCINDSRLYSILIKRMSGTTLPATEMRLVGFLLTLSNSINYNNLNICYNTYRTDRFNTQTSISKEKMNSKITMYNEEIPTMMFVETDNAVTLSDGQTVYRMVLDTFEVSFSTNGWTITIKKKGLGTNRCYRKSYFFNTTASMFKYDPNSSIDVMSNNLNTGWNNLREQQNTDRVKAFLNAGTGGLLSLTSLIGGGKSIIKSLANFSNLANQQVTDKLKFLNYAQSDINNTFSKLRASSSTSDHWYNTVLMIANDIQNSTNTNPLVPLGYMTVEDGAGVSISSAQAQLLEIALPIEPTQNLQLSSLQNNYDYYYVGLAGVLSQQYSRAQNAKWSDILLPNELQAMDGLELRWRM